MSQRKIDYYELSFDEERQIAVKMWETIKREIKRHPYIEVWTLKEKFIKKTFLMTKDNYQRFIWLNDCILCDFSERCRSCPLYRIDRGLTCGDRGSAYAMVCNRSVDIETRLAYCDTIIKAINMLEKPSWRR